MRLLCTLLIALPFVSSVALGEDVERSKDHPLLSRMPGYYISDYSQSDFDSHEFPAKEPKTVTAEGRKTVIGYRPNEGVRPASPLQIVRNCQNSIAKVAGQVLFEEMEPGLGGTTTVKVAKGGQETWVGVQVFDKGAYYTVTIVEKQAMKQDMVSADTWRDEIQATGHTAVYGIYFDTDKAELKPDSDPALQEIAVLLKKDGTLSIRVVGHTDSTGDFAHNVALSEARAKTVVAALTARFGIAAARLSAHGVGPLAPVASNRTEDGKAKNRRVELVGR